MSVPKSHAGAAIGGLLPSILDFEGVAALIDAIAGTNPSRLRTLFRVFRSSEECLEARVVVDLALRCGDPLAPLDTLCRDALQTAADFHLLLRSRGWSNVRQLCPGARATALLNLCDKVLADANPLKPDRLSRCREIRPHLEAAALEERSERAAEIDRIETSRATQCPGYWPTLRTFLSRVIAARI